MWIENFQPQDDTGSLQLFFSSESLRDRYIALRGAIVLKRQRACTGSPVGQGGVIDTNVHQQNSEWKFFV